MFFLAYSTFESGPYLWLEGLYVTPAARGGGHGKPLLVMLAAIARDRGYRRVQWNVLDWNAPAIAFYAALGTQVLSDWRTCRIAGADIGGIGKASCVVLPS